MTGVAATYHDGRTSAARVVRVRVADGLVHIDGDGFPSRAELPGTRLAGEALLKEVLEKYRIPTTMSG
mgnify:CR=1 FL=1